jgi:hypothetical protein
MPRPLPATIVALLALAPPDLAQAQYIRVGNNVHVSRSRDRSPYQEVVIASDPANPSRLIACTMLEPGPNRSVKSAAFASFDGGVSWGQPIVTTSHWANDPTCAYGPGGVAYFLHKVNDGNRVPPTSVNSDFDYLGIHRSADGGRRWEPMIRGPQTNDRPFMAVDTRAGSARRGRLYVVYNGHVHGETGGHDNANFRNTVVLQSSDDRGRTFSTFVARALMDQSATEGSNAAICGIDVLSDGTVLVLYSHMIIVTSGEGGPKTATGKPSELRSALRVLRSRNGGATFDSAATIGDIKSAYNFANARGVPASIAVDANSTRFRDRTYVVWTDFASGRGQIRIAHSTDAAATWSAPRFVNDDSLAAPRAGGGPDHFMATVAVNRDGVVGVLWYDRRESSDNLAYHARFAASFDGGLTWTPSVRVSAAPNDPKAQRDGQAFLVTGGDTAGLTAAADGRFHAVWIDNRTGSQQVWTAAISVAR